MCILRSNTMFNMETGTWECGRLAYCFEDPNGAQEMPDGGRETAAERDWGMEGKSSVRDAWVLGSGS